jgi:High potential iron-sulfur protein
MTTTNRRVFMMQAVAGVSALAAGQALAQANKPAAAAAAAPAMLAETDATAVGLGYKADSTKVDAKKYPKHAATQLCSNCQLYSGKDKEAAGGCSIFAGKQVAAKGWCSAWVKKA